MVFSLLGNISLPCLIGASIVKSNRAKEIVSSFESIPNEDILTKQIESWTSFVYSLSSYKDRKLFENILNDCYKYAAAINVKGEPFPAEPSLMTLLLLS